MLKPQGYMILFYDPSTLGLENQKQLPQSAQHQPWCKLETNTAQIYGRKNADLL